MHAFVRNMLAAGAGTALLFIPGAPGWAQTQAAQSQAAGQATPAQPQHTIQMVVAPAQLDKTLDAKKAKQGDAVTAKLEQGVQIPNAQALPKNTVLEGHIDQVQASERKSDSTLTVTFDKVKLKSGQELPIKATIVAVSEPIMSQQQVSGGMPSGAPSSMPSPSASPGGTAPQGGSMGGGSSAPAPPPQPMSVPQPGSASQPSAPHKGVPGVTLKSDIHQPSSATFTSSGKNVHVPGGTQMELALTIVPPGVRLQ